MTASDSASNRLGRRPATTPGNPVVVWADVDGDGDLDLGQVNRVGEGMPVFIYLNRGRPLPGTTDVKSTPQRANSTAAAWGDVDGDGRLELAVGRSDSSAPQIHYPWSQGRTPAQSLAYRVKGNTLEPAPDLWSPDAGAVTTSLAWGDVDGDGDLDLAVGNTTAVDLSDPSKPQQDDSARTRST